MSTAQLPRRSELGSLRAPDTFWWATGIEDTFITAPHPITWRTLDEYELTGHYRRWREDLDLMASLGVKAARYGIPWHRIQPERGTWQWQHADEPLERLLELGISPQVDLVHYGLPSWIEDAYLNPDYPQHVAEYAARIAERFRGRIHWYTPLNEPRITAWYCGRLGWWPPHHRSWRGFARVMLNVAAGIQATVSALHDVDREIVAYHVDATDLYDSEEKSLAEETERRRQIVFLALDLVSGRVDERHALHGWLSGLLGSTAAIERLTEHPTPPEVIGLNLYPMFTSKRLVRDKNGKLRIRMPYTEEGLVEGVARGYHEHFRVPMMISEIATAGSVQRRLAWLDASLEAVRSLRADGVPIVGYTWWPMFALVTWAWRQGRRTVAEHLLQMGLWDLDPDLNRIPTALVEAYRSVVAPDAVSIGSLRTDPPEKT
ncbi:family 1 glycosylhydrolase [Aestuariivirga sp.]|uniref:family 1 glycosylhydrolase n=1 Tax=Aestuariivirga sp. TaxID=2650926 RepID=UPI00391C831E